MNALWTVFRHPFTWGLLLGLVFAAWAFFSGWSARRALRREMRHMEDSLRRLEDALRAVAEQNAAGSKALKEENDDLKQKNENLRISLAELKNKPDRAEIQKLYLLDKAVHLMIARAPGFATAWEGMLQEAQAELDKTSTGILPWIRRILHPSAAPAPASLPPPAPAPSDDN